MCLMKNSLFNILFTFSSFIITNCYAQSLPVGTPVLEESWRRGQIQGEFDQNISFTIRPVHSFAGVDFDSLYQTGYVSGLSHDRTELSSGKKNVSTKQLPLIIKQQYNLKHPYGWNDGAMIPAKGYQTQISMGLYSKVGPFTIQLQPEVIFAQNAAFTTFPAVHSDSVWKQHYILVANVIDQPERMGNRSFLKLFSGQSSIRYNFKKLSLGVSTENLWWGPGTRNSLLMSNNAPGFPHITLNTTSPLLSPIGSFEGQIISGLLNPSGYVSVDTNRTFMGDRLYQPKPIDQRYLNGMTFVWQPIWTRGLFLGFSRVFYINQIDLQSSLNGYLPVVTNLYKGSVEEAADEDERKRDQLFSFFFRLLLPKEKAEFYGEFGRNDHAGDSRDLLMEPEHSNAFMIGFKKMFDAGKGAQVELMAELTNLQMPSTFQVREQQSWYTHHQVRDGYTHKGQVLGAGIGPGGNSQTLGISRIKGVEKLGLLVERVIHNNDFYYAAFSPARDYWRHWVDLSVSANKVWRHKRFIYDARLSWIKSVNYQWQRYKDVENLSAGLSVMYFF